MIFGNGKKMGDFYDSYLIEDDFTIPSAAFTATPSISNYCTGMCSCTSEWIPSNQWSGCSCCSGGSCGGIKQWECEDDRWLYINNHQGEGSLGSIQLLNNDVIMTANGDLTYKVNLKNKDIKLKVRFNANSQGSNLLYSKSFYIELGGITAFSETAPSNTFTKDYLIEMIKDVTNKDKFAILVNGEYVRDIIVTSDIALLHINSFGREQYWSSSSSTSTSLVIDWIRSQPYFSCQTDSDELWVSDNFDAGSTFDIHSLAYPPTKFCPNDYPAVVRDLVERGTKADYRGTITNDLTLGKSFTVPANQIYEIRYATLFKNVGGNRCPDGYIWNTNSQTCVQRIYEQDYIIADCRTNASLCDASRGEYCDTTRNVCVRPYKIIDVIRDNIIIPVGKNQKSFGYNLQLGDKRIKNDELSFKCDPLEYIPSDGNCNTPDFKCDYGKTCASKDGQYYCTRKTNWKTPDPKPECWESTISFGDTVYNLKYGETVDVNNYLQLTTYSSGRYNGDTGYVDQISKLNILTFKNFDWMRLEPIAGQLTDYYVIKDSARTMCFNLRNDLGINFNDQQAGYSLLKTTDLVTMQSRTVNNMAIATGTKQVCIPVDSARYGELFYTVNPYIKAGDETFFDDDQLTYNYKIVDNIPTNDTLEYKQLTCKDLNCPEGYTCLENGACGKTVTVEVQVETSGTTTSSGSSGGSSNMLWYILGGAFFVIRVISAI